MQVDRGFDVQARIYRAVLVLHPKSFRRAYGPSMLQLFKDQLRDRRDGRGRRVWPAALTDLARSASLERLEVGMRSKMIITGLIGIVLTTIAAAVAVGSSHSAALPLGLGTGIIVGALGSVVALRHSAIQTTDTGFDVSSAHQSRVAALRWTAVPIGAIGLAFAFFALVWRAPVQGGVSIGLLGVAAGVWRVFESR